MKKNFLPILISILLIIFGIGFLSNTQKSFNINKDGGELLIGKVLSLNEDNAEILITKGSLEGQKIKLNTTKTPALEPIEIKTNQKITLINYADQNNIYIIGQYRSLPLMILLILFIMVVIFVARKQGLNSLLGMGYSFLIILKVTLPFLLAGKNPISIAIITAILIVPVTFYLSHGINRKTTTAIIGTIITLFFTAILAIIFNEFTSISGLASEETGYLQMDGALNFKSLLLAGIIISILGILDDITISQASVINQLKIANPQISFRKLYSQAMSVGTDHISSMVNTLVLIYAGASLPLLMLFVSNNHSFLEIINYEFMAQEIIQTFVGSIGLILAVPLTTFISCLDKKSDPDARLNWKNHQHNHHH